MSTTDHTREALIESLCEVMHDAYETAAVAAGWQTQDVSRVPWASVPPANQVTMRAAVGALLDSDPLAAHVAAVVEGKDAEIEAESQRAESWQARARDALAVAKRSNDEGERLANLLDEARASVAAERDRLTVLVGHAEGRYHHIYQGLCPDEMDRDDRDPKCPVCVALIARSTTDGSGTDG